jgi:hypothetical protein
MKAAAIVVAVAVLIVGGLTALTAIADLRDPYACGFSRRGSGAVLMMVLAMAASSVVVLAAAAGQ